MSKKKYGDEDIVKAKYEYKKGISGNIFEGYYIREDYYQFSPKQFYDGKLIGYYPIRFKVCEYDTDNDDYLYTNSDASIQLGLKEIDVTISRANATHEFLEYIVAESALVNSDIEVVSKGTVTLEGDFREAAWIDFTMRIGNKQLYTFMFIIPFGEKCIQGKFCCYYTRAHLWKCVFYDIVSHMRVILEE